MHPHKMVNKGLSLSIFWQAVGTCQLHGDYVIYDMYLLHLFHTSLQIAPLRGCCLHFISLWFLPKHKVTPTFWTKPTQSLIPNMSQWLVKVNVYGIGATVREYWYLERCLQTKFCFFSFHCYTEQYSSCMAVIWRFILSVPFSVNNIGHP